MHGMAWRGKREMRKLTAAFMVMLVFFGCRNSVECGPGTGLVDGRCVPASGGSDQPLTQ